MEDDEAVLEQAQEMLRQLVEMRLQVGPEQFATLARRMNMPQEVLDIVEQTAAQAAEGPAITPQPLSGLVSSDGRPLGSTGAMGLVTADGRPISGGGGNGANGAAALSDEDGDVSALLEDDDQVEQAAQMFQELLGIRLVIGTDNFRVLADRMEMPAEAQEAVESTASGIESEIDARYPDEDEANTVRLLNARMMLGADRFADLAEQVGMPQEMRDGLEDLAGQIEAQQGADGAGDGEDGDLPLQA